MINLRYGCLSKSLPAYVICPTMRAVTMQAAAMVDPNAMKVQYRGAPLNVGHPPLSAEESGHDSCDKTQEDD